MNLKQVLFASLLTLIFLTPQPAQAILGNTVEQNAEIYGAKNYIPRYNHQGQKDVVIYNSGNTLITVVYKDNVSILENISYKNAVKPSQAISDISTLIVSSSIKEPKFTSSMDFVDGFFTEYIYNNGIRAKIIFDDNGNATEIISSMDSTKKLSNNNEL